MPDYTHTGLTLSVLHEPDYSIEQGPDGLPTKVELPGFITLGVEVDGVFVPLQKRKAGGHFEDVRRFKAAQAALAAAAPADDTPAATG